MSGSKWTPADMSPAIWIESVDGVLVDRLGNVVIVPMRGRGRDEAARPVRDDEPFEVYIKADGSNVC